MTRKQYIPLILVVSLCSFLYYKPKYLLDTYSKTFHSSDHPHAITSDNIGDVVDEFNGVPVYYNHSVSNVSGRNLAPDGYNLGLKYQCVEFVKRYYYQYFNHKMPDSYGHAKSFFNHSVQDGKINKQRDLLQFTNGSALMPEVNDLIVFDSTAFNRYGHVAIISGVTENEIEIIQQNPGPYAASREVFAIYKESNKYYIDKDNVLGWLRKKLTN